MYANRAITCIFLLCAAGTCTANEASYDDMLLRKVIAAYQIEGYRPGKLTFGPKERLGQALFFDPIVSGPRGIACGTCHVRSKGSADGLPVAVGLGSTGVGKERLGDKEGLVVPRNALPFFNRGERDFVTLFWDGRVQIGPNGTFETPLGERMPGGFDNLLAVAAVFPPAEPDEMLGRSLNRSSSYRTFHAELVGGGLDQDNMQERTLYVFTSLVKRLLGEGGATPNAVQSTYRKLFEEAYPTVSYEQVEIAHVGNALSAYIQIAFQLDSAPWDHYVLGDNNALTSQQKKGATVFFGKGRCYVCHSGQQFSDFKFHGLAIPQLRIGKHGAFIDYGRAGATGDARERFKFRTPPLRNAPITGPWGHNGIFASLQDAIMHHFNPIPLLYEAQVKYEDEGLRAGQLLSKRDPILGEIGVLKLDEISVVVQFLHAITSETVMSDDLALPTAVPSGDMQFVRR